MLPCLTSIGKTFCHNTEKFYFFFLKFVQFEPLAAEAKRG